RLDVADDVRARVLRDRNDARRRRALRSRPLRRRVSSEPASIGRDDRRRHPLQQDGAGASQGVRPDGRAALGHLDGLLRQRRRLLSLFLFGSAGLRSEEHTSELQSLAYLVCRLLLEKKKIKRQSNTRCEQLRTTINCFFCIYS